MANRYTTGVNTNVKYLKPGVHNTPIMPFTGKSNARREVKKAMNNYNIALNTGYNPLKGMPNMNIPAGNTDTDPAKTYHLPARVPRNGVSPLISFREGQLLFVLRDKKFRPFQGQNVYHPGEVNKMLATNAREIFERGFQYELYAGSQASQYFSQDKYTVYSINNVFEHFSAAGFLFDTKSVATGTSPISRNFTPMSMIHFGVKEVINYWANAPNGSDVGFAILPVKISNLERATRLLVVPCNDETSGWGMQMHGKNSLLRNMYANRLTRLLYPNQSRGYKRRRNEVVRSIEFFEKTTDAKPDDIDTQLRKVSSLFPKPWSKDPEEQTAYQIFRKTYVSHTGSFADLIYDPKNYSDDKEDVYKPDELVGTSVRTGYYRTVDGAILEMPIFTFGEYFRCGTITMSANGITPSPKEIKNLCNETSTAPTDHMLDQSKLTYIFTDV